MKKIDIRHFCDRCHKEYPKNSYPEVSAKFSIKRYDGLSHRCEDTHADFCPECSEKIMEFLKLPIK